MPTLQKVMGPEIPSSQKGHGARDTLPPKRTWDQGSGRDLAPKIPYPSGQNDRHLPKHSLPVTSLAGVIIFST